MAYFSATGTSGGTGGNNLIPNINYLHTLSYGVTQTVKVNKNDIIYIGYAQTAPVVSGEVEQIAGAHQIYSVGYDIAYKVTNAGNITIKNADTFYPLIFFVITKNGKDINYQTNTTISSGINTISDVKEGELILGFTYNHNLTFGTTSSNVMRIFNTNATSGNFYAGALRIVEDSETASIGTSYYVTRILRLT